MSVRDDKLAKAARLRERADALEAQTNRPDPLGEYFSHGVGGGGGGRAGASDAALARTAAALRDVRSLRAQASALETAARTQVFGDDVDGLRALVATHERHIENLTGEKGKALEVKFGREAVAEMRSSQRRKLRAARKRLEAAEAPAVSSNGGTNA